MHKLRKDGTFCVCIYGFFMLKFRRMLVCVNRSLTLIADANRNVKSNYFFFIVLTIYEKVGRFVD